MTLIRPTLITRHRLSLLLCLATMLGSVIWGITLITPSTEIARARNSFIASVGNYSDFTWPPQNTPASFLQEKGAVPKELSTFKAKITSSLDKNASNWDKALAIARHLESSPGDGEGILSNTVDTYQKIMTKHTGYCSDYTQVLNGLAYALHIPVREWGMAFDGFGGYGHAFSEIYDNKLAKWIFIDSFYSFYAEDSKTGQPLSVLEFRDLLRAGGDSHIIKIVPIIPARFGFKSAQKAIDYYRKGMDEFYLWWGNNVFSYDNNILVKLLGPISRALEEGVGILIGIQPRIKIIRTDTNAGAIQILFHRRNQVLTCAFLFFIAMIAAVVFYRKQSSLAKSIHKKDDKGYEAIPS